MLMVEKITHKKVVGLETTEQASVYEKHSCVIIARLASSYKYLGVWFCARRKLCRNAMKQDCHFN